MPRVIKENEDGTVTTTTTHTRTIDRRGLKKQLRALEKILNKPHTNKELLELGRFAAEQEDQELQAQADGLRYQIAELTP